MVKVIERRESRVWRGSGTHQFLGANTWRSGANEEAGLGGGGGGEYGRQAGRAVEIWGQRHWEGREDQCGEGVRWRRRHGGREVGSAVSAGWSRVGQKSTDGR